MTEITPMGQADGDALEVQALRRRDRGYPSTLRQLPGAPWVLYVAGGVERLGRLLAEGTVAIVGTPRASDYGMETARGIARELSASGVTVIGALAEGISAAAHMGALEGGGRVVTVMPGGLDICHPASRRGLYERVCAGGCALAELPCGTRPRRYSDLTRRRVLAGIAQLVIVVEAEERPSALIEAHTAQELDRPVAAVPGRVCSPLSAGPLALLAQGARLVRNAQDALDVLYGVGAEGVSAGQAAQRKAAALDPYLRLVLEEVSAGRDTVAKLTARGIRARDVVAALAELELTGALVRGDGGRYLCRG
jgi:DNA processing protein